MEDHDYAKVRPFSPFVYYISTYVLVSQVIIGEYPYEDPNKPVRQYEGPTDPSLPPHLLTPVLQSFAPTTQLVIKESVGLGQNAHAQSTAALLQQKLSLTQLLQNAQQHKLVLFNQTRSDQSANQPQTKKAKQTDQSSASGSTSAQLPIALFSQPPVGIPLSHLIPIPANMAQQLIASGRVQLQGPTGPVTVQALKVGTSVEKGETQEKKDTVKSEKESSEENKSKTDEKNVANRSEENENHPTSGGRSTRSSYKVRYRA